jgi:DNA end-binding protein Ku
MYPGNRTSRVPLRMLGPEGTPLARHYYSQKTGKDLDADEMVRGYEVDKDKYVIVTDEELERLAPKQSRDIDLRLFVEKETIPPIYFDRSYFLVPSSGSEKAYRLLVDTMEESDLVGIATFVMRGKEYLVAIFPENSILRAETMRFPDEVRTPADIGLPEMKKVSKPMVTKFENVIKKKTKKEIPRTHLKDEQSDELLKLIEKKRARHKDVVEVEVPERKEEKVVDLMEVLKRSLQGKTQKQRKKTA